MSCTLEIKNADLSHYWTAYFNSQEECDKWLEEEKSRPYWKEDFIVEVIDTTPPPPSQAILDAIAADKAAHDQVRTFLKGLKKTDLIDVASCANAIMKIVKHLRADQ